MQNILSVENMRHSDANTIRTRTPGRELMLRAGRAVYENVEWKPPVAVICGSGNNAGDGYVIAGLLCDNGIECTIVLLEDRFSEDGRYYYESCLKKSIPVVFWKPEEDETAGEGIRSLKGFSTIVDCLFGTGFKGEIKGVAKSATEAINSSGAYVVSVDINSGLNGDTGCCELCVRSDLTVSVGSYKPGHFLNMAKDVMKRRINCDIGIEPVDKPYYLLEEADLKPFFKKRPEYSNKGDYGYIALIGGSKRYSGAIRLAYMAGAAMRAGAGVVKTAVPSSLYEVIAANVLESTMFPLSDNDGELTFSEKEFEELIRHTKTLAFGMGIGVTGQTQKALEYLLANYNGRMIIDADGLSLLSKLDPDRIKNAVPQLVLTPHMKEFSRLSGKPIEDILKSPISISMQYASDHGVILLLKGPSTIVTDGETVYITDAGCSGMATAGSGDVLSDILAAVCAYIPDMYAQMQDSASSITDSTNRGLIESENCGTFSGIPGRERGDRAGCLSGSDSRGKAGLLFSAAAGAFINGRAGELAQRKINSVSMIASDTVSSIAEVISGLQ
ncbi:MAG: NAD(P)H-hydrate dehydratase [Lachnospiraceae bacterium]|nr:NAD(P)H-hydrate dehydratase [Lachnospiraceae bacterium]